MKTIFSKKLGNKKGLIIVPIFKDDIKKINREYPLEIKNFIKERIAEKEFKGNLGEKVFTYLKSKQLPSKLLLLGLGKKGNYNIEKALKTGGHIGKHAQSVRTKQISIFLLKEMEEYAKNLTEAIKISQYEENKHKTKIKSSKVFLEKTEIITKNDSKNLKNDINTGALIAEGIEFTKDLVNLPSNEIDSKYFEKTAREISRKNRYKITVLSNKQLEKIKAGGILAVNQGSEEDAKMIVMEYKGAKNKKEAPIVLIGKAIIFDTGGYNLKPTGYIETMHQDMAGGATILGIFKMLKKLGIQKNVIGIIGATENLINEKAYRPSDIITMLSGDTVEIVNTDAEGRLILADCISYVLKSKINPQSIITIATLTGSIAIALGQTYAGLFGNNERLTHQLKKAGEETYELFWEMPIHKDFKNSMKSKVADLRNHDGTRYAGASTAAAFLQNFVKKNKWSHIDIGGTAFLEKPKTYAGKGATAYGFKSLIQFLFNLDKKNSE